MTIEQELELAAATGVQTYVNNNQASIEAKVQTLEDGGLALLTKGLQNLAAQKLKVGGGLSIFAPEIQALESAAVVAFEAQAQALIAKYGPPIVYGFLQHEAALAVEAAQKA